MSTRVPRPFASAWFGSFAFVCSAVIAASLLSGSAAHAARQVDGQEWPGVALPPIAVDLIKAIKKKGGLDGADALGGFLALLPPGYYTIDGPVDENLKPGVLQHDILYAKDAVEYRVDLSSAGAGKKKFELEHRSTMRYGIHTGANYAEAGEGGFARARLLALGGAEPSVSLKFTWMHQYHSRFRLIFNPKLSRIVALEVSGPVSDRPGFKPVTDLSREARVFTFTDRRPAPFIETDCATLITKITTAPASATN